MTATHVALIVTHALFVVAAAVMLVELVRLRRTAWRLIQRLRGQRLRGQRLRGQRLRGQRLRGDRAHPQRAAAHDPRRAPRRGPWRISG